MAASQCYAFALLVSCIAFCHHAPAAYGAAAAPANQTGDFLGCLAVNIPPAIVYTHASQSYPSVLESGIKNLRFVTSGRTSTPVALVEATDASHVQAAVRCGARYGVHVRSRSGGHDYEGLSYRSLNTTRPFAVVDMAALREVRVDVRRETAWVGSGATLGEVYYAIANKSARLGFPGSVCPTVGVGGSGGSRIFFMGVPVPL
ncbi:hypothetical protein GUJ93_ZPchr0006g44483 [Zizania palustris]|uniref:FAD-binding PCMH-type domain-containing protein n=1 Tax=Zizania palustris TaxID=103762 RepID=A0A8J5T8T7_ZIZPA|nr:hypothetical protein GUJ93_ZPchr0006g44483 [Zizania palustris]